MNATAKQAKASAKRARADADKPAKGAAKAPMKRKEYEAELRELAELKRQIGHAGTGA